MMHTKVPVLAIEYQWERTMLRVLLVMLALLTIGYLYFVAASVLNVIAHREADARSAKLENSIGLLEREYFALSQDVTPAQANTLGLTMITNQSYVYRHGNIGQTSVTRVAI